MFNQTMMARRGKPSPMENSGQPPLRADDLTGPVPTLTPHLARYAKRKDFQTNRLPEAVARSMQSSIQIREAEQPRESVNKVEKARRQREQAEHQNRKFKVFLALKPILFQQYKE